MELYQYFKSLIDQDRCAVVMCNLKHEIIYMNPAAKERYAARGGASLVGKSLLECHSEQSAGLILQVMEWFSASAENNIMYTYHNAKENKDVYMIALRTEAGKLIGYYEKHEYRDAESSEPYGALKA